MRTTTPFTTTRAQAGDWIETYVCHGGPPRLGRVIEVLGGPGREHFRVRWHGRYESIVYPGEGISLIRGPATLAREC